MVVWVMLINFRLFRVFDNGLMDGQTLVILETENKRI